MNHLRRAFKPMAELHLAEILDELFEGTRRRSGEKFREFNNRFNQARARLKRGCHVELPDVVASWQVLTPKTAWQTAEA